MKLYTVTQRGELRYLGTQAEVRDWTRQGWSEARQVEVPTDKAALIAYLNALAARPGASAPATEPGGAMPPTPTVAREAERAARAAQLAAESDDTTRIAEWIFAATNAQIENTFSALGARFHEMRKAACT